MSVVSGQETRSKVKDALWKYFCTWDCHPFSIKIQYYVGLFVLDAFVDLFITICILANTAFMAMERNNMPEDLERATTVANKVILFPNNDPFVSRSLKFKFFNCFPFKQFSWYMPIFYIEDKRY